ncbi:sulfatase [Flavobacteriaceae bacterium]|nr:sulfatase [Flavobacteriaceae bacterium]
MKTRISFIWLFLFFLTGCKQTPVEVANISNNREKSPNIILILTDDQGYADLGAFGAKDFETPHIDQMAKEGALLTQYYAPQAVCSASRAGILTGCYPNRIGIHNAFMPEAKKGLNPAELTIAEMLKPLGYATAIYGKWHLGDAPEFLPNQHGFDEYFGIPYSNDMWPLHPQQGTVFNFKALPLLENGKVLDTLTDQSQLTTQITQKAVSFINAKKDQPFFLYVAHPQPHVPLYVSEKFKGKSKNGLYGDVIMELDWSVGEILNALKVNGLEENTMVIFTSDNGPWLAYGNHAGSARPLREGKGTAWEGGQREPFVVKYPRKIPAGTLVNTPVMGIDIMPTVAALTGGKLPHYPIDGKSVMQVLSGERQESPQEAYFFYYRVNELFGVRYGDWKMYFPHRYRTMAGQSQGADGLPGQYAFIDIQEIELYHLPTDEAERTNVAQFHPEVVSKIQSLAADMRLRLGDALTGQIGKETRAPGMLK